MYLAKIELHSRSSEMPCLCLRVLSCRSAFSNQHPAIHKKDKHFIKRWILSRGNQQRHSSCIPLLNTYTPSLQILFSPYSESEETLRILTSKFESTVLLLLDIEDCIERQWVLSMLQCLALVCEFVFSWLIKQIKITVNLWKSIR